MRTLTTIAEVREWRRARGGRLGLVPTMGSLHPGHVSLVDRARAENDWVAATVFVNPTQFGAQEDFSRYPRDVPRDQRLLEEAGCELLFSPTVGEMYPPGFETAVDVGSVAMPLEGARRPGHFRGVATVVLKLLAIFEPDSAYFGEKDAQQLAVIRRLVRDLDLKVEIRGCPIVREADGLAFSSRNRLLSAAERRAAPVLYRALTAARECFLSGERDGESLRRTMGDVLAQEPLARTDYVSVADPENLQELGRAESPLLLSLAVFFGSTRLIDNLRL